jgi:hypothetical protein
MLVMPLLIVVGCGGSAGGGSTPPPPTTYTIGGTVSGLTGTGLILQDNSGNNLAVSASGSFTFSSAVDSGAAYSVTVLTQPTGQSCTVTSGSGTASANVTNVQVSCSNLPPTTYTIGGTVSGLTGTGLVLQDNSGNNLAVSASGSFIFSTAVASGAAYSVTVLTQPTGQSCTVTSGSGTASANVTNVQVTCTATTYTIGGTISGLTASGLVLADGSQTVSPASGATSFAFSTAVASGSSYAVTVKTQPSGETCSVTNGSGTASANVSNVQVTCTTTTYTIGGTVSGLTGSGLVLQNNSGNNLAVSASGSFTFSTAVDSGAAYSVMVLTQPTGQSCTVTNGSGTASANVSNVQVTCTATTYTIGGAISGLTASGLVLADGSQTVSPASGATSFAFPTAVASGSSYAVTVKTQPSGETCSVTNGSGTASANVTNVQVACVGLWTWMGGSSKAYQSGVYGTLGTAASTNIPGARDAAVSWSDASGNLWLFGGRVYDSRGGNGYINDLWKFDPSLGATGEWTWMGGSSTAYQSGVYGTLGTAAPTNIPGARVLAVSWSDASGNLWLFGGIGYDSSGGGALNDLWKFDPSLGTYGEWAWMGGSSTAGQSGVYGTLGTAASTNIPGARDYAVSWSDASGNLWLFGGFGNSAGTDGALNDLWKFDPALGTNGEWTWMGGSTAYNQSGVYGTLGTAASTNIPGARILEESWSDASGNLWLFSGQYDPNGADGWLSDLWKFDPALGTYGEWTWTGGSSIVPSEGNGVYGTLGTAASTNIPGARDEAAGWSDASGNLWLFGGGGYDGTGNSGNLNDLWKFDPALGTYGEWTWMGGSSTANQYGVYGTLGTAASTNIPGARGSAVTWSDASGNLWLFGGGGYDSAGAVGYLNDLWKYQSNLPSTTYTIGGTVSGLTGTGLVLQDNSGNNLAVSASGSFTFSTAVASGAAYGVTVLTQPTGQSCTVTNGSGTASANVSNVQVTCTTTTYTIGGTVSGLTGTGLILQDNSGNNLAVSANGAFTFSNGLASGAAYSVTVLTQPTGQSCSVTNFRGTATANVTNVQVTCSNITYTIGGTVSGLTGTGLVLQDNGGNNLAVSADGAFTFSNGLASGAAYSVTVLTQPTGQSCTVTNGSGTTSAYVSNVQVTCSTTTYTIGGMVSGLTGTGLVLRENGVYNLSVSASGSFTFSTAVASGSTYSVTVFTQPTGQSCTVANGGGTAIANVTNVQVACSNNTYTIGGTVSGLTGTGLVLQDNGGNNLAVSANGAFTFSNPVASGSIYYVTVLTQPSGQSCTVTNGFDTPFGNVTNVQVACSNITYYTIGGTVSGLTGTGLVLTNAYGGSLSVSANGPFTLPGSVASGLPYWVMILTQPTGQSCTVTNGSGTASANVTSIQVACSNITYYTIGGTVSGLFGTLVLQDNGGNNLALSANANGTGNGSFTFSTAVASGATYSVTVLTQPTGQTCTVTNGSGTASANVTNVQVACSFNITYYGISGTISGYSTDTDPTLVLQDNGGDNLSVGAGNGLVMDFTFGTPVAQGAIYSVTVLTQPNHENCTVTNGSGWAYANVMVQVTCTGYF